MIVNTNSHKDITEIVIIWSLTVAAAITLAILFELYIESRII